MGVVIVSVKSVNYISQSREGVDKNMKVHSDKKRKPRYYVTEGSRLNEKVVHEADDATEVLQWAIDNTSVSLIELEGEFEPTRSIKMRNGIIFVGEKERVSAKK